MTDPVAAAIRDGRLAPHEADIVQHFIDHEADEAADAGEDPQDSWVADLLGELPAGRARPVAAAAPADLDDDEDDELDSAIYRLSPPTPARPIAASAPTGPWGTGDPVTWGVQTGRLGQSGLAQWRDRYARDPIRTAATIRSLTAILPPGGASPVAAAASYDYDPVYDACYDEHGNPRPAGYAAAQPVEASYALPMTTASPPRPAAHANYVEELRSTHPGLVAAAEQGGPAPTLFAAGDYPDSTASGISPDVVAEVPSWRARAAAAWEPNQAQAHRIVEQYSDPEFGPWEAATDFAKHPAVQDHIAAVSNWARSSGLNG